jgi:SEC-C motif-containing protein
MKKKNSCPCGSALKYDACCGPLLAEEKRAETAEQLMRSRFTANVMGNSSYLQAGYHPSTRPEESPVVFNDWFRLDIKDVVAGGTGDETGIVEFRALYRQGTRVGVLHERSRFCREGGRWYYLDGELLDNSLLETEKMGRNSPCLCGSGKKYKKCCLVDLVTK